MAPEVRKARKIYNNKQIKVIVITNDRRKLKNCEYMEREDKKQLGKHIDYGQCKRKMRYTLH